MDVARIADDERDAPFGCERFAAGKGHRPRARENNVRVRSARPVDIFRSTMSDSHLATAITAAVTTPQRMCLSFKPGRRSGKIARPSLECTQ
jgi:hypothetical protein